MTIAFLSAVIVFMIIAMVRSAASDASAKGARLHAAVRTLPRSSVQGLINRMFIDERVQTQSPAVILSQERHPQARGELVLTTGYVHFLGYDDTGYGVDGVLSFRINEVQCIKRRASDTVVVFVDDPSMMSSLNRAGAITTRFAFEVPDASSWARDFVATYDAQGFASFENESDDELMEQPIIDWAHRVEHFAQAPRW